MRRLLVTGGGTGGHVYPALSIAEGFSRRHPDAEVLYVGGKRGIESEVVPAHNIPFRALEVSGVVGKTRLQQITGLCSVASAAWRARGILRRFRPDAVVGTGGYASVPAVLAAQIMRIPTMIQEQNTVPGRANRLLSHSASIVALPAEQTAEYFPERTGDRQVITGNPIRRDFVTRSREDARQEYGFGCDDFVVVAFGGSIGSEVLNQGISDFVWEHFNEYDPLKMIYVTGHRYHHEVMDRLAAGRTAGDAIDEGALKIYSYLDDVPAAMVAGDLLLCRAGAMTLAEATAVGLPMIIVPSPNVSNDEQRHNARRLEEAGAAVVIEDEEFSGQRLHCCLLELIEDTDRLQRMAVSSRDLGRPHALDEILDQLEQLMRSEW